MNIDIQQGFTMKVCGNCGVVFFIPDKLEIHCKDTGQAWHCPNGHGRSYSESESEKYKRLFEQEKQDSARLRNQVANLNAHVADMVKKIEAKKSKKVK